MLDYNTHADYSPSMKTRLMNQWPHLALLFSAGALATALISQYGFGTYPCELCLYQRGPYALIAFTALYALWKPSFKRISLILITLLFVAEFGLAAYHVSVEMGVVESSCGSSTKGGETLDELRAMLKEAPIVSCSDATATFLSISMASWNALASGAMSLIFMFILMQHRKESHAPSPPR